MAGALDVDVRLAPGAFAVNGRRVARRGRGVAVAAVPDRCRRGLRCAEMMHLPMPPKVDSLSGPLTALGH